MDQIQIINLISWLLNHFHDEREVIDCLQFVCGKEIQIGHGTHEL